MCILKFFDNLIQTPESLIKNDSLLLINFQFKIRWKIKIGLIMYVNGKKWIIIFHTFLYCFWSPIAFQIELVKRFLAESNYIWMAQNISYGNCQPYIPWQFDKDVFIVNNLVGTLLKIGISSCLNTIEVGRWAPITGILK